MMVLILTYICSQTNATGLKSMYIHIYLHIYIYVHATGFKYIYV
jgi:hypothetical protein